MIFLYSTDDRTLQIFESEAAAIAYAEGIDVEEGVWQFFDADGAPLDAIFTKPNNKGSFSVVSGNYHLRPAAEGTPLSDYLAGVATVEGPTSMCSVTAVQKFLASNKALNTDAPKGGASVS